MPTYDTTSKHGSRALTGSNVISDIDAGFQALRDDIDNKMAAYSEGPIASRPVSTPGSPGKTGRIYRATDGGGSVYYLDNGTGWDRLARVFAVATQTWDPASIPPGERVTTTVAISGVQNTDLAIAQFPNAGNVLAIVTNCQPGLVNVSALNMATVAFDAASATLTVMVLRP